MDKIIAELGDEQNLFGEDSVEIFIFPQGSKENLQFVANTIGSRWNGAGIGGRPQPLSNWQARCYTGKDFWSCEIKMPWDILGTVPAEGEKWRMNVCRNIPSAGELATWAELEASFHEPDNFGIVVFAGKVTAARRGALAAHYTFDEGTGSILHDNSGNKNHGKIYGAKWVKRDKGYALRFDGADDYVDCGRPAVADITGPVTVEAWVFPEGVPQGEAGIIGKSFGSYALTCYKDGHCYWYISGGENSCKAPIDSGAWQHIASTFDGQTMKLYVNGDMAASRISTSKTIQSGGSLLIGRIVGTPEPVQVQHFRGMIDAVRIYSRALAAGEIESHYKKEAGGEEILLFSKPLTGTYLQRGYKAKRLTYRQGPYVAPRLSPDKRTILFHSKRGGKIGIWLTDEKGDRLERMCDGDQGEWSPDGRKIIFRRGGRIVERDLATGTEKHLTARDWTTCAYPSYLPDGSVVFVRKGKPKDKLFLIRPDRKESPRLLLEGEMGSTARCSPDGTTLAYQDGAHIYLMNLEDKSVTQLTTAAGVQAWPVWSLDGGSIIYCQATDRFGPWDICRVDLRHPQVARFMRRGVHPAHDWSGIARMGGDSRAVMGTQIAVWTGEALGDLDDPDRLYGDRAGWKRTPAVTRTQPLKVPVLIENDWFFLGLNPQTGAISLWPKSKPQDREKLLIVPLDESGRAVGGRKAPLRISIVKSDNEGVIVQISSRTRRGEALTAICRIPRSRPYVEIKPLDGAGAFLIKKAMRFAVIPDRFANDLLLDPAQYAASEVFLPFSPFVLGFPQGDGNVLMLITPSTGQSSSLAVEGRVFSGIKTFTKGESIFVSLLPGRDHWCEAKAATDPEAKATRVEWAYPFAGQWRTNLFGAAKNYSLMVDAKKPSKIKAIKGFTEPVQTALVYLYGRNANTPLNVLTPEDILRDALGIQLSEGLLDVEGITGYRTTEEPIPLQELLLPSSSRYRPAQVGGQKGDASHPGIGWRRFLRPQLDFSPVLELLGGGDYGGLRMSKNEGIRSTVAHLCGDISNLLKGLDRRRGEYETFLSDLERLCGAEEEDVQAAKFLRSIKKGVRKTRLRCAGLPVTKIAEVDKSIRTIKGLVGSGGLLGRKSQFDRFCEVSISALAERQRVLEEYREFAKMVRERSGYVIVEKPGLKNIAEELRRVIQKILRNRYFLEGDWRGETPRNGGAL